MFSRPSRLVFAAFGALVSACFARGVPLAPVENFTRVAAVHSVSISESGHNLVYLTADESSHVGLAGVNLETMVPFSVTLDGDDIYGYRWLTDARIAFNVVMNRRWSRGLYAYKLGEARAEGINERDLTQIEAVVGDDRSRMYVWYQHGAAHRRKGLALVDIDRRPKSGMGRVDDEFVVVRWVASPPGDVLGWGADRNGQVRLAATFHEGRPRLWLHGSDGDRWEELPIDMHTTHAYGFNDAGDAVYVIHDDGSGGTDALRLYDLGSRTFGPELFRDPDFGLDDARLRFSRKEGSALVGIHYLRDAWTTHWFSEPFQRYQAAVDAKLPGRLNHIIDWDDSESRLVIKAETDRQPSQYYLYSVEKGTLSALPPASPWIDPTQTQPMQTVRFKSRDGLQLQGYLTLPAPRSDGVKPALVVLPHGGPWARDAWGWDSDVQFLVSRGYAVFQPNYRGSTGFKPEVSGERSAFRAMYDDVADGTDLVTRSGLVDPGRVAIYGGSFGGYLALAGAVFDPERYRCAISFAGVFDWAELVDQARFKRGSGYLRYIRKRDVGDPRGEAERFNDMSPIHHVAKIKIPLLLAHGVEDRTVEDRQTKDLVAALKQNRVKYETLYFKDEGHGFADPANEAKFLARLEQFLAKHL